MQNHLKTAGWAIEPYFTDFSGRDRMARLKPLSCACISTKVYKYHHQIKFRPCGATTIPCHIDIMTNGNGMFSSSYLCHYDSEGVT